MHGLCAQPINTMYCLIKRKCRTSKSSRVDKQNNNNLWTAGWRNNWPSEKIITIKYATYTVAKNVKKTLKKRLACLDSNPTLGARGFSCAVSCFGQGGLIVTGAKSFAALVFSFWPKTCRLAADKPPRRRREKSLVPGVFKPWPGLLPSPLPRSFLFRPRFSFRAAESLILLTAKKQTHKSQYCQLRRQYWSFYEFVSTALRLAIH